MIEITPLNTVGNKQVPFRLTTDKDMFVKDNCVRVQELSERWPDFMQRPFTERLHLDSSARTMLRQLPELNAPVCFHASIPKSEGGAIQILWTVVPENGQYSWYGFPAAPSAFTEGRMRELELVVGSLNDVVLHLDKDGNYINYWVRDPQRLYLKPSLFLGRNIYDIFSEHISELADLFITSYEKARKNHMVDEVEYQIPANNEKWFSCRFTPVMDGKDDVVGMLQVISDITKKKSMEIEVQKAEAKYRDLFENANDIIYILDMAGRILSINRIALEKLEVKEEEVLGKYARDFFSPDKLDHAMEQRRIKIEGESEATIYESEYTTKSGRRIPVEISSRLIYSDGKPSGIHVTARDISRQKMSQIELAKSEAKFRFLSEYSRDLVCLHKPNGEYIYVSPSSRQLLGYDPSELIGKSPYEFFHPDEADNTVRLTHEKILNGEVSNSVQYRYRRKNGEYIWMESVSHPIIEDGEVVFIQTNTRDITERKHTEQLLIEKDRLSSALSNASRTFLSSASLDEALRVSFPVIGNATEADGVFLVQYDQNSSHLVQVWGLPHFQNNPDIIRLLKDSSALVLPAESCKPGVPIFFDAEWIGNNNPGKIWLAKSGIKSLLLVPIVSSYGTWGVLGLAQSTRFRIWNIAVMDTMTTFASVIANMIERTSRDELLRRSEERFRSLFQNSLDIVYVVDAEGKLTYVTPSLTQILGYQEQEVLNQKIFQHIHPEEKVMIEAGFKQLISGPDHSLMMPMRVKHKAGHWIWMEMKGQNKLSNPDINGVILSLRDITEHIQAQKTLKQYSDRITGMLNSVTDGFIAVNKEFKIIMWNKVAEQLLGRSSMQALGGSLWSLFENSETSDSYKALQKVLVENKTVRFEQYIQVLNRWFDGSAYPYQDGIFIYFKDITDRKRQEKLLELEKDVLEMNTGMASSIAEITERLLKGLEGINPGLHCVVCMVRNNQGYVNCLSAPSMPDSLKVEIERAPLGPDVSVCGRSMATRSSVSIPDISKSDLAVGTRDFAALLGLRSCWSLPIISSSGELLGTFTAYYEQLNMPNQEEKNVLSQAANILRIIIENKLSAEKVRISNERYVLATRATNEAIWDWDAIANQLFWGEGFANLFGYSSGLQNLEYHTWEENIHPEDKERVLKHIREYDTGKKRGLFMDEYRFRKADGNYAIVLDKGYCMYDEQGKVIRMIGSMEDITERKKLEEQLLEQEIQKQKQIAQAVVEVQESEREEIGKELHDNVNQLLTTAKLFLEVAYQDPIGQQQLIKRSSDTIMNAINEIRKISRSLMPASVSDIGLISSINDIIQNISIARSIVVDFRYDANLDKILDPKQKLTLFRIIQEQINNILRHAMASSLLIEIRNKKDSIKLVIADNGIGFDLEAAKKKNGVGLSNIMSRAALFNARVKVNTAPGKGCELIIELPNALKT
ncbi:PAS domain S-box protein [Flavihumibacter rivuli]|uniref:PAS domain S-box protein n=1 Tax=Flavihumibacter rivuli TaxID=2838156 RepID=UPI001BDE6BF5|nr:PAS domain S-box protein [Flavihumibacter rivuli]ULQ56035.1 PAS domain S-box protein [Flavihumibacter rivuli]